MAEKEITVDHISPNCVNCKRNIEIRSKSKASSSLSHEHGVSNAPSSEVENKANTEHSVTDEKVERYCTLPVENNPFTSQMIYYAPNMKPKLCLTCAKHWRNFDTEYTNCVSSGAIRDERHPRKKHKRKVKGTAVVRWLHGRMMNPRWNPRVLQSQSPRYPDPSICVICRRNISVSTESNTEEQSSSIGTYTVAPLISLLNSLEKSHQERLISNSFKDIMDSERGATASKILDRIMSSPLTERVCNAHVTQLRRNLQRVEDVTCASCSRSSYPANMRRVWRAGIERELAQNILNAVKEFYLTNNSKSSNASIQRVLVHVSTIEIEQWCSACSIAFGRTIGQALKRVDSETPNYFLQYISSKVRHRVSDGEICFLPDEHKAYMALFNAAVSMKRDADIEEQKYHKLSYRSFVDYIRGMKGLEVVPNTVMPDARRGAIACSAKTLGRIFSIGMKSEEGRNACRDIFVSASEICSALIQLAALYAETNYMNPDLFRKEPDLVEEIRRDPNRLWTFFISCVMSQSMEREQKALLKRNNYNIDKLPFPYCNNENLSRESLENLNQSSHRRVMRAFACMQQLSFAIRPSHPGPFIWGLSSAVGSNGGQTLLRICNGMGLTVHPDYLQRLRNGVMEMKKKAKMPDLVAANTHCSFAFDNIDAKLSQNVIIDASRDKQVHGTVLMSQQIRGLSPITSKQRYSCLSSSIKNASDMLNPKSTDVSDSQALALGIIACFGEQLLAPSPRFGSTFGFIVRHLLEGYTPSEPAVLRHIKFLLEPSNNSKTVRNVISTVLQVADVHNQGESTERKYVTVTADEPLYERMINIIYGAVKPGERSSEMESIVPLPGGLHFLEMALLDVLKRLGYHGFMDGLIGHSGLNQGAASRFLDCKEPRTNYRVLQQISTATVRRIIDVLIESGHVLSSDIPSFQYGGSNIGITEKLHELMQVQESKRLNYTGSLRLRSNFPGIEVIRMGYRVLGGIKARAAEVGQHQFKHFALDLVTNMLLPSLMIYYYGRAGQISQRFSLMQQMSSGLYCTGKTKYHRVFLYMLREYHRAPPEVRTAMIQTEYATTNIRGINEHANQEVDEVLEETAILRTKEGCYRFTGAALELSFYSSDAIHNGYSWIRDVLWKKGFYINRSISNWEKRLCVGASKMYIHLCGSTENSKIPWLGVKHCSFPELANVTVTPPIVLTATQSNRLLQLDKEAERNMQLTAVRCLPEMLSRISPAALKASRKERLQKLECFKEHHKALQKKSLKSTMTATELRRRTAVISSTWKEMATEMKSICITLANPSTVPEVVEMCKQRLRFMTRNIDVMSKHPDAFLDNTGRHPKAPQKSRFWQNVQTRVLGPESLFIMCGYPLIPSEHRIYYAVDLMNVIHMPFDLIHSLSVQMHVTRCANAAVSAVIRNHQTQLFRLDLHVDKPSLVVLQKRGTQMLRDSARNQGSPADILFNLDSGPPKDQQVWQSYLADRDFKECLTVAVCAESFISAASQFFNAGGGCIVTASGANMLVGKNALRCQYPSALKWKVVRYESLGVCALIYNKGEDNIDELERSPSVLHNYCNTWYAMRKISEGVQY